MGIMVQTFLTVIVGTKGYNLIYLTKLLGDPYVDAANIHRNSG